MSNWLPISDLAQSPVEGIHWHALPPIDRAELVVDVESVGHFAGNAFVDQLFVLPDGNRLEMLARSGFDSGLEGVTGEAIATKALERKGKPFIFTDDELAAQAPSRCHAAMVVDIERRREYLKRTGTQNDLWSWGWGLSADIIYGIRSAGRQNTTHHSKRFRDLISGPLAAEATVALTHFNALATGGALALGAILTSSVGTAWARHKQEPGHEAQGFLPFSLDRRLATRRKVMLGAQVVRSAQASDEENIVTLIWPAI